MSFLIIAAAAAGVVYAADVGREVAVASHLGDGEEFEVSVAALIKHGQVLFDAMWTNQEGGGRPLTKGTGAPLADASRPLTFPRNFNRVSAPDANSCGGCHSIPASGGGGDIVANVFVLGQRFDFATFQPTDVVPTGGAVDENGTPVELQTIANSRATTSMFGSGYIEMLARQITADLQVIRNTIGPGESAPLHSKGISFGTLSRGGNGNWDVSEVEGLTPAALRSTGPTDLPSLVIHPWHQASAVVSLRQFANNAFNHHHGIQSTERFGIGTDPDGDGFVDEMTRADVTAVSVFQATLSAPGRVIPRNDEIEAAVLLGEERFAQIGCAGCHIPALPLTGDGHIYTEPNPFNPAANLRPGDAPVYSVDLNDRDLPGVRLRQRKRTGITWVPAFTDFKLHDITSGPDDGSREVLNMHFPGGSAEFLAGNGRFLTKRLWGAANEAPFFHHGLCTTMREAIEFHAGEAQAASEAFKALPAQEQDAIIEFLKTLQVLPEGVKHAIVDGKFRPRRWPPREKDAE
jgi:cytochrome c peroxidase